MLGLKEQSLKDKKVPRNGKNEHLKEGKLYKLYEGSVDRIVSIIKKISASEMVTNVLSIVLASILSIITFLTEALTEVESPFVKTALCILILSIALFNIAKAYSKYKNTKNNIKDKDNE